MTSYGDEKRRRTLDIEMRRRTLDMMHRRRAERHEGITKETSSVGAAGKGTAMKFAIPITIVVKQMTPTTH